MALQVHLLHLLLPPLLWFLIFCYLLLVLPSRLFSCPSFPSLSWPSASCEVLACGQKQGVNVILPFVALLVSVHVLIVALRLFSFKKARLLFVTETVLLSFSVSPSAG